MTANTPDTATQNNRKEGDNVFVVQDSSTALITKTCPCNKHGFFSLVKFEISLEKIGYFSYFCSKDRLWVHVRTASPRRF